MKVIVKYYGSLDRVREIDESVKVSELLAQYAIVDIAYELLDELRNVPEIIYIEEPRRVYPTKADKSDTGKMNQILKNAPKDTQEKVEIMQNRITENELSGKGVIMGIIDSGDCVKKNIGNFRNNSFGNINRKDVYRAAIYIRLSRKDKENTGFYSESIYSQSKIINEYIENYNKVNGDSISICDIYIDDGYSGQNFDRPEFKRMIYDIEDNYINCIVVKDLSRIGRDYIEVGRFLKYYLRKRKIRLISIADVYDTKNDTDIFQTQMYIQMKSIINDEYSRDISGKVRSQLYASMRKGNYVGAFAPYGYKKSCKDKNKLIPDKEVTDTINDIFYLRSQGYSLKKIADCLNDKKVLTPFELRKKNKEKFRTPFQKNTELSEKKRKWYPQTVSRILSNEIYAGVLSQGKNRKISYKLGKTVKEDREKWVVCEKKELAVVENELYMKVNKK